MVRITPPDYLQPISGGTFKEQTWIAFAGAYLGAIIGAIGSIIIMFRTLSEGRLEKVENRKYADYLYVRDRLEEALASIDESGTGSLIIKMGKLVDEDFKIPNLDRFASDLSHERALYRKLIRALTQTIIPHQDESISALKNSFKELFLLENAIKEFVNKIIVDNNIQQDLSSWPLHRASLTDLLYEKLVKDVKNFDFQQNEDLSPIKYSFANDFGELHFFERPESFFMGPEESKTAFPHVYSRLIEKYIHLYSDLSLSVFTASQELLASFKKELVLY